MKGFNFLSQVFAGLILFGCLAFYSCNGLTKKGQSQYLFQLRQGESINLELDSITSLYTSCLRYISHDEKEYLLYLNNLNNSIYRFDLNSADYDMVSFEVDGPDGVGVLDGFDYRSEDTLLLISNFHDRLSIVKSPFAEKQITVHQIVKKNLDNSLSIYGSNNTVYPVYGGRVFFPSIPNINPMVEPSFTHGLSMTSIDLTTGELKTYNVYTDRHKDYWSYQHLLYSSTLNPVTKRLIISHPMEENIVVFDLQEETMVTYLAQSDYIDRIESLESNADPNDFFYKQPHYGEILYDSYRQVYYRMAHWPLNNDKIGPKEFSVSVFDLSFNKLGELYLPHNEFIPVMSFVSKDGLMINQPQIIDRKDATYAEDVLRFVRFELIDLR